MVKVAKKLDKSLNKISVKSCKKLSGCAICYGDLTHTQQYRDSTRSPPSPAGGGGRFVHLWYTNIHERHFSQNIAVHTVGQ